MPTNVVKSEHEYVIYSPERGLISEHETSEQAVKAFIMLVAVEGEVAAIYRRAFNRWEVF